MACVAPIEMETAALTSLAVEKERAPRRGKFIILDGADGCGKGSMLKVISAALGCASVWQPHVTTKHPGGTLLGNEIRRIMFETVGTKNIDRDALELLFLADHVEKQRHIEDSLRDGDWVIADRWYTTSNPAYSYVREVDPELSAMHYRRFSGVKHDMLFLMHGDPEVFLARANARTGDAADGGHQPAKKWNTPERARLISERFIGLFGADSRTILIQADTPGTVLNLFTSRVGPEIQRRSHIWLNYGQLREKLARMYPKEGGWLY